MISSVIVGFIDLIFRYSYYESTYLYLSRPTLTSISCLHKSTNTTPSTHTSYQYPSM